ncbi:hypothetical protein EV356DRAFT_501404 [Viridothelium virens]|uniref:Uncharacterized protein n=1 Tax=Viridothelium virens TaxID=1048519 RepID=A0A6A6H9W4_VIRVR|nr:hypothetical protein EV356DRAFT_501404 [Viridothelium virens]
MVKSDGVPSKVTIISVLDACAVVASLVLAVFALVVIYNTGVAIALGFKYQFVVFGLVLSAQGFATSRQVLLCALRVLFDRGNACLQDVEALSRNSMFTKKASWTAVTILVTLAALGPLLSALYKPFFLTYSSERISSIEGHFGVNPPPELLNLNGNGIALAVNRMTPFWQTRSNRSTSTPKTYGQNTLVINENMTVMLDTPSLDTFQGLRAKLSPNEDKNQSISLSADVNATVSNNVEMTDTERSDFGKIFDNVGVDCVSSAFHWCTGLGKGWYAGMVLGGVNPSKFPPANLSVNYIGIWNQQKKTFSQVAQKFLITRQYARGTWHIDNSTFSLTDATLIDAGPHPASQAPLTTGPLGLDLFGQLLEEYNYKWYDFELERSPTTFMASIVWARLATLRIEDRSENLPYFKDVHYDKLANEASYTLNLQGQTVSRSPWLVLIFLVHPILTVSATLLKAWLHKVPVSDQFGLVSLLSSLPHESSTILDGAGYSGTLARKVRIWLGVKKGFERNHDRIVAYLGSEDDLEKAVPKLSTQVESGQTYC